MKKAFTLIELLVVIAIIAILAAILFPVFAQAKLAAKQSVNVSNHKQLGLAILMYCNDYDDYYPLATRTEPMDTAFFGVEPWSVSVQPYVKNWGLYIHPLGPSIPTGNAAITAWRQTQMYGVMAKAENTGYPYFQANPGVGSFARRVCGSAPCEYEGLMGAGCDPNLGCPAGILGIGGTVSTPSASATSVASPGSNFMMSEGAMWNLWSEYPGIQNPCTYGVYWNPGEYNVNGSASYAMMCPAARHNPLPQAPDGACTPSNVCDGVMNEGIQNGQTTYVATDGHAKATDYRGGLMKPTTLSNGTVVIANMWPAGVN